MMKTHPPGGGDGGSGDNDLPGDGTVSKDEVQTLSSPFLAIKTIRMDGTGDGSGASELQMHVAPVTSSGPFKFNPEWNYVFDHKWGTSNRPIIFGDGGFFEILGGIFLLLTAPDRAFDIETGGIFSNRNTRTIALDARIYETPDVNNELVNYSFTNMRSWELQYNRYDPFAPATYVEVTQKDYFPAVLLSTSTFRILLMEADDFYSIATGNDKSTLGHDVWTFNMATGAYEEIYTEIRSYPVPSNSDDLMWHSGVSHINYQNALDIQQNQGDLKFTSPGDFMWEFVLINRSAPFYDPNN